MPRKRPYRLAEAGCDDFLHDEFNRLMQQSFSETEDCGDNPGGYKPEGINYVLLFNRVAVAVVTLIPESGEIRNLAVDPQYRGKGIGHVMLDFVQRAAERKGCRHIVAASDNNHLDFYRKAGFHVYDILSAKNDGIYLVAKSLG